jgi:glycine betaine/choline ABC-type transport system substrate-binding protein
MDVINSVNSQLSQRSMIELNAAVDLDGRDADDVAGQFLRQRGLIGGDSS